LDINLIVFDLLQHTQNTIKLTQTKFKMEIKPIRNEADYKKALERLEVIFDEKRNR